jgi:hypothetical protein
MIGRATFPRLLGCDLPCTGRGGGPKGAVLRGGAFNNNERNVRCAYRNRNNPNNRNNNIGFRVVCGVPVRSLQAPRSERRTFFVHARNVGRGNLPDRGLEKWRGPFPAESSTCVEAGHIAPRRESSPPGMRPGHVPGAYPEGAFYAQGL